MSFFKNRTVIGVICIVLSLLMLPFWYVQLTASHFKKDIAAELETALSIVTTAYLRSENILTAVEENLRYLNPPVHQVFKDFVLRVKLIDPDVLEAIKVLRTKIDNEVFREWCDALCDCQHDRSLKVTLTPIVSKLSDMRIVNGELEYLVFEPRKEFIIMVIFVMRQNSNSLCEQDSPGAESAERGHGLACGPVR